MVKPKDILSLILLTCSLILNVVLGWKVQSLNRLNSISQLSEGSVIDPLVLTKLNGDSEKIFFDGSTSPIVFYFFAPNCSWCARNHDNISFLINKKKKTYRFLAISLSELGLDQYTNFQSLEIEVYRPPSPRVLQQLKLGATPQTLVVSEQGVVLKNWIGAYQATRPEVESFFDLSLPGVSQ